MATLQKLRNAGPLLVIFVGIALLAFVAGDALRIFQSPQGSQAVGEVNGEEISAVEYQEMFESHATAYKTTSSLMGNNLQLSEMQMNRLKDDVWNNHVNYQIIKKEADKIGLTVTDEEITDIVTKGVHPIFREFPIFFDFNENKLNADALKAFLAEYESNKEHIEYVQQAQPIYDLWKFIENNLRQSRLVEKYNSLITNSIISNPVVAENTYNSNNVTYDVELKAYPYSAIADSTVKVKDSDIEKIYNEEKETHKSPNEFRNAKYVSYQITPSPEDRNALRKEMTEYADTLKAGNTEYANIARLSNSDVVYSELAWAKDIYPEEVQLRIDSVKTNEVVGPIYNQSDDSYTVFKYIDKKTVADSVLYRCLTVNENIADSLITELKKGASFKEMLAKYTQGQDSAWLTSAMYEGMPVIGDNEKFVTGLINGKKGEYASMQLTNAPARIIYQVIDTKNPETKYNAIVIKRTSEFSQATYDEAYNKFSQFVASCKTEEDLEKNAEEYGYRILPANRIANTAYNIANIADTRNAVRWLFSEAEVGQVSPLYECGNNDNLLVLALTKVTEKGYAPLKDVKLRLERKAKENKKAEKIISELNGKSFEEIANISGVKSDAVKRISFDTPAHIKITSASEPAISAAVTKLNIGEVSAPIKGNNAVYVVKLTAKNNKPGEFNAENQQKELKAQALRSLSNYALGLYEKANVVDNRYLYF